MAATRHGTEIINGVERSSPPPPFVLKAMERRWAEKLVLNGQLRLSSFQYYKSIEDAEVGDHSEGHGRYRVGNDYAHMGSAYAVFLFCTSLPDTDHRALLNLQAGYDTLVRVNEIEGFAHIVKLAAYEQHGLVLMPYIGYVNYDRDEFTTFDKINAKPWAWNAFQKDRRYAHQREYRCGFQHYPTARLDGSKTEEEHREEFLREHVHLHLTLPPGLLEIIEQV